MTLERRHSRRGRVERIEGGAIGLASYALTQHARHVSAGASSAIVRAVRIDLDAIVRAVRIDVDRGGAASPVRDGRAPAIRGERRARDVPICVAERAIAQKVRVSW